jgi:transcriptional regulator with XRE-family HTH domain
MDYGKAVRVARAISGIQQKELADRAGLNSSYVSLIEMGKRKPSLKAVRALSSALEMPPDLLTLLGTEPEDLSLAGTTEVEEVAKSLFKVLLAEPSHKDEPKAKTKKRVRS